MTYIDQLKAKVQGMDGMDAVYFLVGQIGAFEVCAQSALSYLNESQLAEIKSGLALAEIAKSGTLHPFAQDGFKSAIEHIATLGD